MTTELAENDVYLSIQQAAELLRLSRMTIHKLMREKKLISYGPTRQHFFRRSDIITLRDTPKEQQN
jgi:excisionase family DNA binding protein